MAWYGLPRDLQPSGKPATVCIVCGITISCDCTRRQLDVNHTFLQGTLEKDVYMAQPVGFVDKDKPTHVCKLQKVLIWS